MRKLNVIHLGYSDIYGGASVAMLRIHDSVSKLSGVQSKIAVIHKVDKNNPEVLSLSQTFIEKIWCYIRVRVAYKLVKLLQKSDNKSGRSINWFPSSVVKKLNNLNPDIIHMHWIGNETIKIEDLPKLKAKIIWTFHDQWAYLGAEHTDINKSERFIFGYEQLDNLKLFDFDRYTWKRKSRIFAKKIIYPVAVSKWIALEAKKSYLWKNSEIDTINNPIDINHWEIRNKSVSKKKFNIDDDEAIVVAFGAVNFLNDNLKGYNLLVEAIKHITKSNKKIICLFFGDERPRTEIVNNSLKILYLGYINSINDLNNIYSAADVTVVPSYFESFGLVALESILCGTPVACFNTSGLLDIIDNKVNGFLAEPYDSNSLSVAIKEASKIKLSPEYILKFSKKFNYQTIGEQYYKLYKKIIENPN